MTPLQPINKDLFQKIIILKSMMYRGVLWGLFHQKGWAMTLDQDDFIFPFWLNHAQAQQYATKHWPHYSPRKITPQDFNDSLLPTLSRLNVIPALFRTDHYKLKLSTAQMQTWFFRDFISKTV